MANIDVMKLISLAPWTAMPAIVITLAVVAWIAIAVVIAVLVGRVIRLRDRRGIRPESPGGDDMRSKAS